MLVIGLNPGHDGAIAAIGDRRLLFSVEGEKDSFPRHYSLHPSAVLGVADQVGEAPDVVALGGWGKPGRLFLGHRTIGTGYEGVEQVDIRSMNFFGRPVTLFCSSHERSHIAMAVGMAPPNDSPLHAVLVWEGSLGHFYLLDQHWSVKRRIPVMTQPGARFAFLFALADPTFPDSGLNPRAEDAGKLMALAAYGDPASADPAVAETVDRILKVPSVMPAPKLAFLDSPLHNHGVEAQATKDAAALLTRRIFEVFSTAAQEHLPEGLPLYISGGCGLNCDWNHQWRRLGHFSSVFVPPCANDSGSAIGTAIDALSELSGDPRIDWDVYSGPEFQWDCTPDARVWETQDLDHDDVAEALAGGSILAWVQGRSEIGPRALGNRSLLAEPFDPATRERLNTVKQREGYRPIAPCCRVEDVGEAFNEDFEDPYMLYFRTARSKDLGAVTHVDGSARCQTVSVEQNKPLHDLLSAFAARCGIGVLCNTSLNFKGFGFINRMSDLTKYCEARGISDIVVGDTRFTRIQGSHWALATAVHEVLGEVPSPKAVERLRSFLVEQGRVMDATIIAVLAYAGLRPRELLSLRWSDIDGGALDVRDHHGSESVRLRRVRLLAPLAEDLALWRKSWDGLGKDGAVFPNGAGDHWNAKEWAAWRREVFTPAVELCEVGVSRPFDLRRTFLCLLLFEGMTAEEVALQMGTTTSSIHEVLDLVKGDLMYRSGPTSASEEIRHARM